VGRGETGAGLGSGPLGRCGARGPCCAPARAPRLSSAAAPASRARLSSQRSARGLTPHPPRCAASRPRRHGVKAAGLSAQPVLPTLLQSLPPRFQQVGAPLACARACVYGCVCVCVCRCACFVRCRCACLCVCSCIFAACRVRRRAPRLRSPHPASPPLLETPAKTNQNQPTDPPTPRRRATPRCCMSHQSWSSRSPGSPAATRRSRRFWRRWSSRRARSSRPCRRARRRAAARRPVRPGVERGWGGGLGLAAPALPALSRRAGRRPPRRSLPPAPSLRLHARPIINHPTHQPTHQPTDPNPTP
jgi:hypothetical protein